MQREKLRRLVLFDGFMDCELEISGACDDQGYGGAMPLRGWRDCDVDRRNRLT